MHILLLAYDFRKIEKCGSITIHNHIILVTFHLHIRKHFFTVGETQHLHRLPRASSSASSLPTAFILRGSQNLTGHSLRPVLGDPALSKEVGADSLQGTFYPQLFCNSEIHGGKKTNPKIIY